MIPAILLKNVLKSPETIMLASGPVEVSKFSWRCRSWTGEPIDTYGGKAVLDCEGTPAFAELALAAFLRRHGVDGAVWVDSYRKCFRDAMPPDVCQPPTYVRDVYDRIVQINGRR